jgi:hypothetical protein
VRRSIVREIKTQIWIALIANLIFTLIYQRNKEAEAFVTIVSMARAGLNTHVCILTTIKHKKLSHEDRNNEIVQLKLFENQQGCVFNPNYALRKISDFSPLFPSPTERRTNTRV